MFSLEKFLDSQHSLHFQKASQHRHQEFLIRNEESPRENNKDIFITENFANARVQMQMKSCNFLENNATY